jgi:filamentous hemagglutinin
LIQDALARSDYVNQGKRAFEVTKKLDNCEGFDKGDYVVIDAQHKDHLEVFNVKGEWIHVANFDGTKNYEKTEQGRKNPRSPLQKG